MHVAMFQEALADRMVRCVLCYHRCQLCPGQRGRCGVRENREGVLYSLVYGYPAAQAVDPIEKKPLYHVLPGTRTFSIATPGCNFRCLHCQNASLSQVGDTRLAADEGKRVEPAQIVAAARRLQCPSISYTYSEPTVGFEYVYDTARLATASGLRNILVTNGFMTPDPVRLLAPFWDAANIDLKCFRDDAYRTVCGGRLQPVMDTIRLCHSLKIWIEITTLIIPGLNDDDADLRGIADFLASIDTSIPWHVTAFHPAYRMPDVPPTPPATLRRAQHIGKAAGLHYVYTGNIGDRVGSVTTCPSCGRAVIERPIPPAAADSTTECVVDGCCRHCGCAVPGLWSLHSGLHSEP
ncbi:MAG TPA: AmmeMemoRadiSam system radical SAM enzyme [Verrucomicrobia bacterium]|nr:AmmeMemoRadiSam system radical SAM enzyme [Verrucomicrobiota bacterium]